MPRPAYPVVVAVVLALASGVACSGPSRNNFNGGQGRAPADGGSVSPIARAADAPITPGLLALESLTDLATLKLNDFSGHASSADPTGGNQDWGNFLFNASDGDQVLVDLVGPGCIYRIWFTGSDPSKTLKVYFDGESIPRINATLGALTQGTQAPFLVPLVGDETVSSGGFFVNLPLPFLKSIRITSNDVGLHYYNVDYHLFPPGTAITSWTGQEDSSAVRAAWANPGLDPKPSVGNVTAKGSVALAGNASQSLLALDGPRSISSIRLNLDSVDINVFNSVWLDVRYDNEATPSIHAPLSALFGFGPFALAPVKSIALGHDDAGWLYLYLPMPFAQRADVTLVNQGTASVSGAWEVRHKAINVDFGGVGYLKVQYTPNVKAVAGQDFVFLDTEGAGQVVGVVESVTGAANRNYLEGDEHIYIDDRASPAVQGTGTEDFFNAGWYFKFGTFSLPTHGNPVHTSNGTVDSTTAYRLFLGDSFSFRKHIRVAIQHGGMDDVDATASLLAYYYALPGGKTKLVLSDMLDLGGATSLSAHGYTNTRQSWAGSNTKSFEELPGLTYDYAGRAHTGVSSFTLKVDPNNQGVVLRRLFDQHIGSQKAQVIIDGTPVGIFYHPGSNQSAWWREDDFVIPKAFTAGKASLSVQLQFISSDVDWNEFKYAAYSLVP